MKAWIGKDSFAGSIISSAWESPTRYQMRFTGNCVKLWLHEIWPVRKCWWTSCALGFISISCGGVSGVDPITSLQWITDESNLQSFASLSQENVIITADIYYNESLLSLPNGEQLQTALVFLPIQTTRSKFCYNLPNWFNATEGSQNYLLRAMFPSQNLTVNGTALSGYTTRFYLTVDSTYITTIELLPSIPQTIELVVSSLDDKFYVCLVPLEDKSSMPAISTLELRPYYPDTYGRSGQSKDKQQSSYLMLVDRFDFGGILDFESPPLRWTCEW